MSIIALPASPLVSVNGERFRLQRSESDLTTTAGVTQITSYPDRRWTMQISVKPMTGADLRLWALFALRMTSLANRFAYSPPHYSGPSTGYAGSAPAVAGASQLGFELDVDGLSASTPILLAGDFISFDVTTSAGNTNRQLNIVTADVTSDGSGAATIPLELPIRQAPANDAAVEIFSPTALFGLVNPEQIVDLDLNSYAAFSFDVIERIFN